MKFELEPDNRNVPDAVLLEDIRRVATEASTETLTWAVYSRNGSYGAETIRKRFGSWNAALSAAGLSVSKRWRVPDVELFENLAAVWTEKGSQPRREEMNQAGSRFSSSTYEQRFRSWRKALEAFVAYVNDARVEEVTASGETPPKIVDTKGHKHRTNRTPSARLKVQVLMRDGNKCRLCGITVVGGEIHFDHITPWSRGGETVLENLQVLCVEHNLAKGDLMSEQ